MRPRAVKDIMAKKLVTFQPDMHVRKLQFNPC